MRTLVLLGTIACLTLSLSEAQELRFGQGGNITWQGGVSALQNVSTIQPEFRSLDAKTIEISITPGDRIELAHPDYPGALLAKQLAEGENLSSSLAARIGTITAPGTQDIAPAELNTLLQGLLSANSTGEAFERKQERLIRGSQVAVDLGVIVGVNRVRFFPRNTVFRSPSTPFQNEFLRNFELQIHDGLQLNEDGSPASTAWETFLAVNDNDEPVTVVDIDPPRYLRLVRVKATSSIPYEIEKLQIFGVGFFPNATYLSPIVDLGRPSNWGQIRWEREILGDAGFTDLIVRTRTGSDETPLVYNRREVGNPNQEDIPFAEGSIDEPLSRADYEDLPRPEDENRPGASVRGSILPDVDNWSPWSAPYSVAEGVSPEGVRNTSPAPRTYIQFRVDFVSQELFSSNVLNSVAFEFTRPALADALVAEVFPREVEPARDISFVYAVRADMARSGLQGFNSFEVSTPQRVGRVERLEIVDAEGGSVLDHVFAVQDAITEEQTAAGDTVAITSITDEYFTVSFPHIEGDGTLLKIHFVNRIFFYSTDFSGRALILGTELESIPFQWVDTGDAVALDENDLDFESGTTVLSSTVTRSGLLGTITIDTPIITPNGDGANDRLGLRFEVLTVIGESDIRVVLFDVSGRRLTTIFAHQGGNGTYTAADFPELAWDGSDGQGDLLPPGVYLLRFEVEGDALSSAATRAVALAY